MSSRKPILGVHHYSEETGISLVLPMGWLASEGPSTASFREGTGGEDGICSTINIHSFQIPAGVPDAYQRFNSQLIDLPRLDKELVFRKSCTVDGLPADWAVFEFLEEATRRRLRQHQVGTQRQDIVTAISGITSVESQHFDSLFADMLDTIRFDQ